MRRALARALVVLGAAAAVPLGWAVATARAELRAPAPSRLMLDRHGRFLGELPAGDGQLGYWALPAALPEKVVVATLETEDRSFYAHAGVRPGAVARAAVQNLRAGRVVSGASTVAMQLARLQRPQSRTPWAKLREAVEALRLVSRHGHDRVLRQYLTLAPYGNRAHGVVRAARLYFDKPVEDVSWLQAAFLAALPQQPGRMNPFDFDGRARALRRAHRILRALHARGVIDAEALRVALASDLGLVPEPSRRPEAMHAVLDFARHLPKDAGPITPTTLDLDLQAHAARAVREGVSRLAWAGAGNGALLAVDLPTGEVLAWVGSKDYFDAESRGAVDFLRARRSPGSALKPFVYALGLEKGRFTLATELPDTPWELPTDDGGAWVPENITHTFQGPMLLREALGNSRNIPALRALAEVGVDRAVDLLERGGVKELSRAPGAYGLSLAVGAVPVTAEELAVLYSALAHGGTTLPLRRFADAPARAGVRLLRSDVAQAITEVLADPQARRPGFPAGGPLDFDYAAAVKTGTSQGYRDAWAVAFTDRLLVVAWVGNHDWRRMNRLTGAAAAAPIAHRLLDFGMVERRPHLAWAASFPSPEGWEAHEVCPLSGLRPGPSCTHRKTELFPRGAAPTATCGYHAQVALDVRNGLLATPGCPPRFVVQKALLALPEDYGQWARRSRLEVAPTRDSPLCAPRGAEEEPSVALAEPRNHSRYLFDPDTPRELSTVRLAAKVTPATEQVVFLVDGVPVGQVGWPHELRVPLDKGRHVIRAALARGPQTSTAVQVLVDD